LLEEVVVVVVLLAAATQLAAPAPVDFAQDLFLSRKHPIQLLLVLEELQVRLPDLHRVAMAIQVFCQQ
jgi:hypothetical protein